MGVVSGRFSALRSQAVVMRTVAGEHERRYFRDVMAKIAGTPDCASCGWPNQLTQLPAWPQGCHAGWHQIAEGVIWQMRHGSPVGGGAVISQDGVYRYGLYRRWAKVGLTAGWLMLNPSTADAHADDATIRRCIGFSQAWGFGGLVVRNLYGLRATDPKELLTHPDPVGPDNHRELEGAAHDAVTVCAWGDNAPPAVAEQVVAALRDLGAQLWCLGRTKRGNPRHPLRLPASTPLERF